MTPETPTAPATPALSQIRAEIERLIKPYNRHHLSAVGIDKLCDNIASLLSIADMLEQRLAAVLNAAAPMFETVEMRRNRDALQVRADFLIKRGWTPIPFTPNGAPEGFTAKITHPSQRWQKNGQTNRITEQALKIELKNDTDALRGIAQMEEGV